MKIAEPFITVGILSATTIEFVLNGEFIDSFGKIHTGVCSAYFTTEKIEFCSQQYNSLELKPVSSDASFDLIDVVIGIGFHWERKETQRFKGALKLIVETGKLTAINKIAVPDECNF
jgi:hypothetical protein